MPTLDRDGVSIRYEAYGQGPAVLLSHGYSLTRQMWAPQIEALSRGHRLIVWDMRGHGESGVPADPALYSEALTVADMAAILDAEGIDRAVIGGLSLGGYMSLGFYAAHPERTRALLIIDTGPGFRKDEAREAWNRTALATAERFETKGLAALTVGAWDGQATHGSAEGLALAARGMLTQRDSHVIDSLAAIAVPSLVVVGEKDAPFLAAADYMAAKIPGAEKVVIPDAGHIANKDQPAAFNAAVSGFLSRIA